ncbi:MAG: flagellar basal body-associated FliL family protein [Armatimonadetes bacterium]|nr:flagellar basal body-associated FliL family protein [Armatimonadota bacterium]
MPAITKKPNQNKEKPQKTGGGMRLLGFLLLAVVLGGGLAYGALRFFNHPAAVQAAPSRPERIETLDLGDKVVNLANGESGRYLRVRVVLEYPGEKKLAEEIKARQPAFTEKVLNIFRSKKAEEILPVKNQEKVKEEILSAINEELHYGKVSQVYFTDFLVQ